ncbi:MAG: hypothetical protein N3D10_00115 [Candidatus Micrarchaeota archaeon]|nr:hypothetical protein [Candidatus Micrarchaeota archaeon]
MNLWLKSVLFVFFLFFNILYADFELRNYVMSLTINPDGSVHVIEDFLLFINGSYSIQLYENSFVVNDIASWSERTKISELRPHISRAFVDLVNFRVRPVSVFNCNNVANTCFGKISIEYDVMPFTNSSGLFEITQIKPRTKRYILWTKPFSFQLSKTDDIILPSDYSLKISIPDKATKIIFSRTPNNIEENPLLFKFDPVTSQNFYMGKERTFIWKSQTLSKFYFSFEIEQTPEEEIKDFFLNLQTKLFGLFIFILNPPYFLSLAILAISFYWLNKLEK